MSVLGIEQIKRQKVSNKRDKNIPLDLLQFFPIQSKETYYELFNRFLPYSIFYDYNYKSFLLSFP